MENYRDFLENKEKKKVYLIAEAGVNYENSKAKAKLMIKQAAESGANSIKFQSYKANSLASKVAMSYWDLNEEKENSQHSLFSKYDKFNFDDFSELKDECDKQQIEFATSVFDHNEIGKYSEILNYFKVASADITNYPLHLEISKHNKPVILSTGAAKISEISEVVDFYKSKKIYLTLLHCVLNYPCDETNAMLKKIKYLKKIFPEINIGYSDHVPMKMNGIQLLVAKQLGASVIEKHFTYDKSLEGNDHYHSMDCRDIMEFRVKEDFLDALLDEDFNNLESQSKAMINARRSIVVNRNLKKGDLISMENICIKRPGTGINPKQLDIILGLKLTKDVDSDTPITFNHFK